MLPPTSAIFRYAFIGVVLIALSNIGFTQKRDKASEGEKARAEMEIVKAALEGPGPASPELMQRHHMLAAVLDRCSLLNQAIRQFGKTDLIPENLLCLSGNSIAAGDPTLTRFQVASTGNGIVAGCPASANSPHYDAFSFNLTGCAAFPTVVTVTMCGTGGCAPPADTDGIVVLYRKVAAGDPFTATGTGGAFNPASACTNAIAADDDLSGAFVATGGASCNQLNTADCLATCGSSSTGGLKRSLGPGRFTIVVEGFLATDLGNYNLTVDAPSAGCTVALAPTAANVGIAGRVIRADGSGIMKAAVTVSGGSLSQPVRALTNAFGYYSFPGLEAGQTYMVSVSAKAVGFAEPVRVVPLVDDLTDLDFVSFE